jgi:hypothetical protein
VIKAEDKFSKEIIIFKTLCSLRLCGELSLFSFVEDEHGKEKSGLLPLGLPGHRL